MSCFRVPSDIQPISISHNVLPLRRLPTAIIIIPQIFPAKTPSPPLSLSLPLSPSYITPAVDPAVRITNARPARGHAPHPGHIPGRASSGGRRTGSRQQPWSQLLLLQCGARGAGGEATRSRSCPSLPSQADRPATAGGQPPS